MQEKKIKTSEYFSIYTMIFVVMVFIMLNNYFYAGRTLIYNIDGFGQHYRALIYFSRFLKGIWQSLINNHELIIPQFDIYIGEGNDILNTFHYYVYGDPLNLLSIFVDEKNMHLLYDFLIIFRIYLAGATFSCLCIYKKKDKVSYIALLAATLTYVFNYYVICYGTSHPYFINPMIYFPLIILGVEKIIDGKSIITLSFSVFVSAISNIYFFYMIVVFTVIYVIIRIIFLLSIKKAFISFIKIAFGSLLGLLLAAFIVLPIVHNLISDTRFAIKYTAPLFYSEKEYSHMIASIFEFNEYDAWSVSLGLVVPSLFYIIYSLFSTKKHIYKVIFLIIVISMITPLVAKFYNCNSYVTIRWMFAIYLPFSYMICDTFDEFDKRMLPSLIIFVLFAIYNVYVNYFLHNKVMTNIVIQNVIIIAFVLLLMFELLSKKKNQVPQYLILLCFIISACYNGYVYFNDSNFDYINGCKSVDDIKNFKPFSQKVKDRFYLNKDDDLYRYSLTDEGIDEKNTNVLTHAMNTQYYWSFTNSSLGTYRRKMNIVPSQSWNILNYDSRTIANYLSGVRYIIVDRSDMPMPYGYNKVDSKGLKEKVYKNDFDIPIVYCYNSYIMEDEVENCTVAKKEEIMFRTAIINKIPKKVKREVPRLSLYKVPIVYSVYNNDNVMVDTNNKTIKTKDARQSITHVFENVRDAELYMTVENLKKESDDDNSVEAVILSKNGHEFKLTTYPTWEQRYGVTSWTYELGHFSDYNTVNFYLMQKGDYTFDNMYLEALPNKTIDEYVNNLKDIKIIDHNYGINKYSFDVSLDNDKLLCFAIPYSIGFTAFVDGIKTDLYKLNYRHMGVEVTNGTHSITLVYETPYLKEGICITFFASLLLIICIIVGCYGKRKKFWH